MKRLSLEGDRVDYDDVDNEDDNDGNDDDERDYDDGWRGWQWRMVTWHQGITIISAGPLSSTKFILEHSSPL